MRALAFVLLALPLAAAQADLLPEPELTIDPFAAPVRPLQGVESANLTLRVPCALAAHPQGAQVVYRIADAPRWASVTVSPSSDVAQAQACADGVVTLRGTLVVSATDQAPAHAPTPLRVVAEVKSDPTPRTAAAETNVTAAYFPLLDVQLAESQKVVAPGQAAEYPLTLANVGNGATRVRFELVDATDGIEVELPQALVVGSKQQGSAGNAETVRLTLHAKQASGFVNRVEVANVRVVGEDAVGASPLNESHVVSVMATVRSAALDRAKDAPAPPLALLVPALAAAVVLRNTRRTAEKRG